MPTQKPVLPNGFRVSGDLVIKSRIERIFHTEIYELSNGKFLYLFLKLSPHEIVSPRFRSALVTLSFGGREYPGLVMDEHSPRKVKEMLDSMTTCHGFECVAGMRQLKEQLRNEVIEPLLHPGKYDAFRVAIPHGMLLFGPPGCGKTFIVRKLAEELGYSFFQVKHSDIASPYIHGGVGKIAHVFEMARMHAPSIVFIDEFEGLVPRREFLDGTASYKHEEVNEFLLQINDARENGIFIVAASNRPQLIDTAMLRSGRIDKKVYVPPPDPEARKELFKIYLCGRPHDEGINFDALATLTENYICSDIEYIVNEAARSAILEKKAAITEDGLRSTIMRIKPSVTVEELQAYANHPVSYIY